MNIRLLITGLLILLGILQYKLWISPEGVTKLLDMENSITQQTETNRRLEQCNRELRAEVVDLKSGKEALEERARNDLGMVKSGEIFVSMVGSKTPFGLEIDERDQCTQEVR